MHGEDVKWIDVNTKSQKLEKIERKQIRNDRNEKKRDKDRPFNESTGWSRRKVSTGVQ